MMETDEKELELMNVLKSQIYPIFSDKLKEVFGRVKASRLSGLEEIRLRVEKPLMLHKGGQDFFLTNEGILTVESQYAVQICSDDIQRSLQLMSNFSVYSIGEELRQGFLTLPGGHRVGLAGRGIMESHELKLLKNISSLNVRIAREVKGCAAPLLDRIAEYGMGNLLLISPPGYGKTTLLRDLARVLSNGDTKRGIRGSKVGIVDERSEIAGCHLGIPQRDVGVRTDVLDACHKVIGIQLLLRSMSPNIIAVDEIGSQADAEAIEAAVNSGVYVVATSHGKNLEEARRKRGIDSLLEQKLIDYVVVLDRSKGPGTISEIVRLKQSEKRWNECC